MIRWEWELMNNHTNTPYPASSESNGAAGGPPPSGGAEGSAPAVIIDALEATVVSLERLLAGRSSEELRQAAQDGGWGIVEILSHIQDWEEVAHERVRRILEETRPELEDYDDSLWAIEHDYGSQDGHEVLACIAELRRELVERLRPLELASWQRPAILTGEGEITLHWLMQRLMRHDAKHIGQAREVFG